MACRRYAFSLSSARPGLSSHSNESTDDVGVGAFDGSGVGRFDGRCEWWCEAEPKDRFTPRRESACSSVSESRTYGLCKGCSPSLDVVSSEISSTHGHDLPYDGG